MESFKNVGQQKKTNMNLKNHDNFQKDISTKQKMKLWELKKDQKLVRKACSGLKKSNWPKMNDK